MATGDDDAKNTVRARINQIQPAVAQASGTFLRRSTVKENPVGVGANRVSNHARPEGLLRSGPNSGRLLRPFSLTASDGATVQLTDFRQRSNVVLILHHATHIEGRQSSKDLGHEPFRGRWTAL